MVLAFRESKRERGGEQAEHRAEENGPDHGGETNIREAYVLH